MWAIPESKKLTLFKIFYQVIPSFPIPPKGTNMARTERSVVIWGTFLAFLFCCPLLILARNCFASSLYLYEAPKTLKMAEPLTSFLLNFLFLFPMVFNSVEVSSKAPAQVALQSAIALARLDL